MRKASYLLNVSITESAESSPLYLTLTWAGSLAIAA